MKKSPKLLVIVDPDQAADQPVIRRAKLLAQALGAEVYLFATYTQHGIHLKTSQPTTGSEKSKKLEVCEYLLATISEQLQQDSLECQWSVNPELSLNEAVLDLVEGLRPAFVLKESHFHRKIVRALFHRSDWELIKQCPVPLWLVKPGDWPESGNFIACIDPMHQSDPKADIDSEIMQLSSQLATSLRGRVDVFHSLAPFATYAKPFVMNEIVEKARSEHKEELLKFLSAFDISTDQLHMKEGFPETVLNDLVVQLNSAVVVIGALARHGINSMLLGSTAQRVLDKVTCDVLVVKPTDFNVANKHNTIK